MEDKLESTAGKSIILKLSTGSMNLLSTTLNKILLPIDLTNKVNNVIYTEESLVASSITMESLAQ